MRWTWGSDSSNVEDRRGMRPGGTLGIGGLLIVGILSLLFHRNLFQFFGGGSGGGTQTMGGQVATTPQEDTLAQLATFVLDDAQQTWARELPAQTGTQWQDARLVLFRDQVQSACGIAGSATGPFYCPGDQRVYIDLGFYKELADRFGAPGDFAQAYVLAHELGHHVQNLLGLMNGQGGGNRGSVRLELQADCFAGVWGASARQRGLLDPGDVEEGLNAAAAVGDDRIEKMQGEAVNPESFTHGSSAQRVAAFRKGFDSGKVDACR